MPAPRSTVVSGSESTYTGMRVAPGDAVGKASQQGSSPCQQHALAHDVGPQFGRSDFQYPHDRADKLFGDGLKCLTSIRIGKGNSPGALGCEILARDFE